MLNKDAKASKKRIHWDESAVDNEGASESKRQRKSYRTLGKEPFSKTFMERIKAFLKLHFAEGSYDQLRGALDLYSLEDQIKILSIDFHHPIRHAACTNNIDAMRFITENIPHGAAYNMVHDKGFMTLKSFLCHTCTFEELDESGQFDHQKRIEGFKVLLAIEHEDLSKEFDRCVPLLSRPDTIKSSLRKDFAIAIAQLQEEGIIPTPESSITKNIPSNGLAQRDLLKHLDSAVTDVNATSSLCTPHSLLTGENSGTSIQVVNKPETAINTIYIDSSTKGASRSNGI